MEICERQSCIGTKRMVSAGKNEDKDIAGRIGMRSQGKDFHFAICIEDRDCEDLEKGRVYRLLADEAAAREGYLRIVDESAEDYLYPESYFVLLDLPQKARKALMLRA